MENPNDFIFIDIVSLEEQWKTSAHLKRWYRKKENKLSKNASEVPVTTKIAARKKRKSMSAKPSKLPLPSPSV